MPRLDDFDIVKEPAAPQPDQETRSAIWIVILAAIAILAAAAGYYYWTKPAPAQTPRVTVAERRVTPEELRQQPEPGENIDVPPLDETDLLVRELVRKLSAHPTAAAWLAGDDLIRNFTVVTANIASGSHPERHLRRVAPSTPFFAQGTEDRLTIDPRSYARYDRYAEAVAAIDARGAARLYATLKPRIEEAYRELGEPTRSFDEVLERAIVQLLRVPVVTGPIALTPKPLTYAYADPRFEALTPPQKHLLRMGPDNVRRIQQKLREIATYLGIPASRLPAAS